MKKQTKLEQRRAAYEEFIKWAQRHIADSVIRQGFSDLDGAVLRIINSYRTWEQQFPKEES